DRWHELALGFILANPGPADQNRPAKSLCPSSSRNHSPPLVLYQSSIAGSKERRFGAQGRLFGVGGLSLFFNQNDNVVGRNKRQRFIRAPSVPIGCPADGSGVHTDSARRERLRLIPAYH